jgi:NAD-dependent SIR2 family protein deacetylase
LVEFKQEIGLDFLLLSARTSHSNLMIFIRMNIEQFTNHFLLNAPQLMWLLGAGASRSANMPSATDIIWDLKRRYYCLQESREITDNDLSNESVRKKIQAYFDSLGAPAQWADDEYAYYFKLLFGDNPDQHQKYLEDKLNPDLISLNSGHRILAALLEMQKTKLIFTTNFDAVIEQAYAFMTGKDLQAFNLNGSYAALNALNSEQFPIYAKMHGDFRYFEMKNLPEQLQKNDEEIEKCFINACARYGMVVTGYSGRDHNVMDAFEEAIENNNAFPKGLFWITSVQGFIFPRVKALIDKARQKGINAHIIEADTFDALMSTIWKQVPNKLPEFDKKIRRSIFEIPKIPLPSPGSVYPIIRTNAFHVSEMPTKCLAIDTKLALTMTDFKAKVLQSKSSAIAQKENKVFAWGALDEIHKIIPSNEIQSEEPYDLSEDLKTFKQNSLINALYQRAIARAVVKGKPLVLRKRRGSYYAVVASKHENFKEIEPLLKKALQYYDFNTRSWKDAGWLSGSVPGYPGTYWMECAELSLEYINGKFWLVVTPDIWVEPSERRRDVREFINMKKRTRYNQTQNSLLDVWKKILLGDGREVTLSIYDDSVEYNAVFKLETTTAYSQRVKL